MTVAQLLKKFPAEDSLPRSQQPATGQYSDPDEYIRTFTPNFLKQL
jgi:hypothetical protein